LQDSQGHALLAVERSLQARRGGTATAPGGGGRPLLAEPLHRFTQMLLIALGILALCLAAAVAVQLHWPCSPWRCCARAWPQCTAARRCA
jgi:hypothetical protein